MRNIAYYSFICLLIGCSEYKLSDRQDTPAGDPYGYGSDNQSVLGTPDPLVCDNSDNLDINVSINEDCIRYPESGILDAVIEWRINEYDQYPEHSQAVMAPVIGQLTDDNFDGIIDFNDYADIVLVTDDEGAIPSRHGILRMIAGNDGTEQYQTMRTDYGDQQVYPYRYSNAALGDVDADGEPEIIIMAMSIGGEQQEIQDSAVDTIPMPSEEPTPDSGIFEDSGPTDNPIRPDHTKSDGQGDELQGGACHVAIYDRELNLEWLSDSLDDDCGGHAPAIADLEGDGIPEIVVGPYIFNGVTGELNAKGGMDTGRFNAYAEIGFNSVIADLDLDGVQEIIAGRSVYDPDGNLICQGQGPQDGFTAAADLDMDGYGDFIVVGNQSATIYDRECNLVTQWALQGGGTGGPPTIADYDGDLEPEIGLVDASTYSVYDVDGSVLWSAPVTDMSSHATGSSVFDFEGDGYPEVVYADELALFVFDGRTGQIRLYDQSHNSRTLHEYPTIADLDNDGSAEIVVINGGSHYDNTSTGMIVYGSESSSWEAGRQVWNQHAYSITNINDDLSIPSSPLPNWPTYNNFRSGDVNPLSGEMAPDAIPLSEICLEECFEDRVVVHVRIGNQGLAALRSGMLVRVYTYDEDAEQWSTLASQVSNEIIESGGVSESLRFRISNYNIADDNLYVKVDPLEYVNECDSNNNFIEITEDLCP